MIGDLKFKFIVAILIFVTISLIFQVDFKDQITYVFDEFDINVEELTEKSIEKIISYAKEEIIEDGFNNSIIMGVVENEISEEKNIKLDRLIKLSTTYNGILIRGYEVNDYVIVRYYIKNKDIDMIISEYKEKFITEEYKEKDGIYKKDDIEINIFSKWDCITFVVKGL